MKLNPFIGFILLNPQDKERESEEARGVRLGGGGVTRRDLQRLEKWENRGKRQKALDPRPGLRAGALRGVQPGFPGVIKAGKHLFYHSFSSFVAFLLFQGAGS